MDQPPKLRVVDLTALAATLALAIGLSAGASVAGAQEIDWTYHPLSTESSRALPPIPDVNAQLVLDDDQAEGEFGIGSTTATQFMWFNRFTPGATIPFNLEEIWVLFPSGDNMTPGAPVEIVVYHDPDGDPTNGADLLLSMDTTIQVADGNTFSVYPVNPGLDLLTSGDVLIGVISRFVTTGVTSPTRPAAIDVTQSQQRSWVAVWTTDPPSPPLLPADGLYQIVDGFQPGNWMIRGFGTQYLVPAVPTADRWAVLVSVLLVAIAGAFVLLRRISS